MLLCIRASDGAAFYLSPQDLQPITTLDQLRNDLLSPLLAIPPECIICMNEEGAQLRNESVAVLALQAAASPAASTTLDQPPKSPANSLRKSAHETAPRESRLFVFDRAHLDDDPERVAQMLAITDEQVLDEPELQPQDPLESHVALSHHNLETLRALINSIAFQRASLALALSNLTRVNTGTSTSLAVYRETAAPSLAAWDSLLGGWEACMEAISKVSVVSGLLGRGAAGGAGHARDGSTGVSSIGRDRERFLGDYVSPEKMQAVRDGCAKVLNDLKVREAALQTVLENVLAGTAEVAADFENTSRDLEDLEACETDAYQGHLRIEELVRTGTELSDPDLIADCFEELSSVDAEARDRIRFLVVRKNAMTRYLVLEMQRISNLQSDVASMPSNLGALDHDLRTKTDNFKHIARLEGLIPAYIATVVEVVRRREFARLLSEYSASLSKSVSHLSSAERGRRTQYRTKFSGKLPWEVRGLGVGTDDAVPDVDFGLKNDLDELPDLKRDVVEGLQAMFAELESSSPNQTTESPFRKGRRMLDELVKELDSLQEDFARLTKSSADLPPAPDPNVPTVEDLEKQVRALEESKEAIGRELQAERSGREEELAQLNLINGQLAVAHEQDEATSQRLREQVATLLKSQAQAELERRAWERERSEWSKERRDAKSLFDEVVKRANLAASDLRLATSRASDLERQLDSSRTAADDLARQLHDVEDQHTNLRSDHDGVQWDLQRARSTINDLESQARASESNHREVSAALADKDRLLRDERVEAELNRAVLENELQDLRHAISSKDADLVLALSRSATLEEVAAGLREQIARWELVAATKESEVGTAKKEVESALREREEGIVGVQRDLVATTRIARAALKLAGTLRDENQKLAAVLSAPAPSKSDSSSDNVDKVPNIASTSPAEVLLEPAPLDYADGDLQDLLDTIQKYNQDVLTEAVRAKVETLTAITKKWSKEAKAYRERAHRAATSSSDKIAFRNFAKGDLALFLPTRNSAVPVWAAFNVSFPHHFLSATGIISDQMKTREWIVARITSLTEKVVDAKDASSNPYLLSPGTKFFLLEVEPWSSKEAGSRSRKHSNADKGRSPRPEERRSHSTGHIRESRSESSALPPPMAASAVVSPPPTPEFRRTASAASGLPSNATDLARSEFAIVEEEEVTSRPPSPATLKQPVPQSEEPFTALPVSSPSALARALARGSPPSPKPPHLVRASSYDGRRRSDPFSAGPFGTSPTEGVVVTPPATDFEPTITPAGAFPAFLPSRSSAGSGRIARASSKPKVELGTSPASTTGSYVAPRSASGSSILSASMHRRTGSTFTSSPPAKAQATQETQGSSSRWAVLTKDLATATEDGLPKKGSMTVGRNTKGWPASGTDDGVVDSARTKQISLLDSFISGRKATPATPQPTGSLAASSIQKALGSSSTPNQ